MAKAAFAAFLIALRLQLYCGDCWPCGAGLVLCPSLMPIASPDTTMLTRRFCVRPLEVELSATGLFFPKPCEVMLAGDTPWAVRNCFTVPARFSDSFWL